MADVSKWTEAELEAAMSEPSDAARAALNGLSGDIAVLGAGGKMGPTLCMMLKQAAPTKTVYAVSRFTDERVARRLGDAGVTVVRGDLLDEDVYPDLPAADTVYYLVGMKFGATGNQPLTWAMNAYIPALVARRYAKSRIAALSTGNVYPLMDASGAGASEQTEPDPIGEYAQSCLGRERIFEYFSEKNGTPVVLLRLNYANEPRYGIIVDLTLKILSGQPIDLTMGAVNLIYQRDANDYIARSVTAATSPATVLNVTGPARVEVRKLAKTIGRICKREVKFTGTEAPTALLSDASMCHRLFGPPETTLEEMVQTITEWVTSGKRTLSKPTKYDVRTGKF